MNGHQMILGLQILLGILAFASGCYLFSKAVEGFLAERKGLATPIQFFMSVGCCYGGIMASGFAIAGLVGL